MSKYKVGDKVLIEMVIDDFDETSDDFWVGLKRDEETSGMWLTEKQIDKYAYKGASKTYEGGLNDAWELARKLVLVQDDGGYAISEIRNIFGTSNECKILRELSVQEAFEKLEAYEESKAIKVGDVVEFEAGTIAVVTRIKEEYIYVCFEDGTNMGFEKDEYVFKKTGRHIDISSLLEQIRGDS